MDPVVHHAKAILERAGYIAIKKDRRVIITSRYVLSHPEWMKERPERFEDMINSNHVRQIAGAVISQGWALHKRTDLDDPITGREVVFDTAIAVIKPKAEDEV